MNGIRHKFFPRSAFTHHQHRDIGLCYGFYTVKDITHGRAYSYHIFKPRLLVQRLPQPIDFHFKVSPDGSSWAEALCIDRPVYEFLVERFGG